ncbi:MAG: AbrB/MazE/SpoVT family DNA-binding domain-containing protein [Verrucomicrobiaceae bacterium]|nr:MAG: AbrB/MazE/SpoVT family DNA-binding domain-containing protein [Verrucomicrobiaceae bacterium]
MSRIVSVNDRGTLTLPKDVRRKLGLGKAGQIILDCDENGQVMLRACAVLPIEIYTEGRMAEFQEAEAELEPFMPGIRNALTKLKTDPQSTK